MIRAAYNRMVARHGSAQTNPPDPRCAGARIGPQADGVDLDTKMKIRTDQIAAVVYVCRDYFVRRRGDGGFAINYCGCYVGSAPTLRRAKKLFRRDGMNLNPPLITLPDHD